jgi:hypothetical protein
VPLTVDYAVLERAVMDLRMGMLEDGTAIGSGLATALNRLKRVPDRSKVILLLTDGENNRGTIDPRTAAAAATALGVKVYTIGVGTEGEAPIPTGRGVTGFRYEILPVRIDEKLLQEIAQQTGGRYFRAKDSEALSRIFQQIDQLEKTPIHVTSYTSFEEVVRPFILAGLIALGLGALGFLVVALSQDQLWTTPDWRIAAPFLAATVIAAAASIARREGMWALPLVGVGLAAAALVLGWFVITAIVVIATVVVILILHTVM